MTWYVPRCAWRLPVAGRGKTGEGLSRRLRWFYRLHVFEDFVLSLLDCFFIVNHNILA